MGWHEEQEQVDARRAELERKFNDSGYRKEKEQRLTVCRTCGAARAGDVRICPVCALRGLMGAFGE